MSKYLVEDLITNYFTSHLAENMVPIILNILCTFCTRQLLVQNIHGDKLLLGLINSDGEEWMEQRRFTLRTLRDFGFGKKCMEAMIMDEVTEVIDRLKKHSGKPVSVNRMFSLAILNSLWTILTSERYEHDDPTLNKILDTATS